MVQTTDVFSADDIARARAYHRPLYWALLADAAIGVGLLAVLAFTAVGERLYGVTGGGWPARTAEFVAVVVGALAVATLPLAWWRGFLRERRWGFSTQTLRGWLWDRTKAFGAELVLAEGALLGLFGAIDVVGGAWPVVAAIGAALLVLLLTFVGPVVFEPLFNRFRPLADEELVLALRSLATRAQVPVRDVLVADASRRTRKQNAYVSGIGPSRRVVLFDTLLGENDEREVTTVVAHELGHRRHKHVAASTAVTMAAAVVLVLALWALLSSNSVLAAAGADGTGDPRVIPLVLLVGSVFELALLPGAAALSRRWERSADRFALELTRDAAAVAETHRRLALSNLSDLDPPPLVYKLLFTHPTPPERIAEARAASRSS